MPTNKPASIGQSILIVDDDGNFRQLLAQIFRPAGFQIIEARNAREGMDSIDNNIGLAIVDYRLPDTDGMTFISQMREAGSRVPVVFISSTFCDAKTFTWLRNILGVSLVLQKPIQPNLFIQQLEGLLPARSQQVLDEKPLSLTEQHQEYKRLLQESAGVQLSDQSSSVNPAVESPPGTNDDLMPQLQQMRKKLEVEAQIRAAQMELRKVMPPEWEKLSRAASMLQANPLDNALRQEALALSHRLRGTAGSLGLDRVSACAAKIEDYVRMLDPQEPTEHELLWGEIFRALADGETGLRSSDPAEASAVSTEQIVAGRILVLAADPTLKERTLKLSPYVEATMVYAETAVSALMSASCSRFDSAIIDLSACGRSALMHVAKELRMTAGNALMPIACLVPSNEMLSAAELSYLGISAVLKPPVDLQQFEEALRVLAKARQIQQPRILTVDDDEVLTRFIQTILKTEGMNVTALNEPIQILDVLEDVEPDLVLLDVMMPGLSGFDVCRVLRDHHRWKGLPIVFLTSKSDQQGRAAAFQAGGNDFLSKPILSEELIARVQAQLDHFRSQRQAQTVDDVSGALKQEVFLRRLQDTFKVAEEEGQQLSLTFITINYFDEFDRYGIFASLEVITALGKLLRSRFKANALRGRWDERTFAIAIPEDGNKEVLEALQFFSKEVEQMQFTGDLGKKFDISITSGNAVYPNDANTCASLIDAAKNRLQMGIRQKTGVTFT